MYFLFLKTTIFFQGTINCQIAERTCESKRKKGEKNAIFGQPIQYHFDGFSTGRTKQTQDPQRDKHVDQLSGSRMWNAIFPRVHLKSKIFLVDYTRIELPGRNCSRLKWKSCPIWAATDVLRRAISVDPFPKQLETVAPSPPPLCTRMMHLPRLCTFMHPPSSYLLLASPRNDRTLFDSDLYENKGTLPTLCTPKTEFQLPGWRRGNRYLLLACAPFIRTVYDVLQPPVKQRQSNERGEPRDKLARSLWNQFLPVESSCWNLIPIDGSGYDILYGKQRDTIRYNSILSSRGFFSGSVQFCSVNRATLQALARRD